MKKRYLRLLALLLMVILLINCLSAIAFATTEEDDEVIILDEEKETKVYDLPEIIMKEVKRQENNYPGIEIGVGIYSLDGSIGYEYNADTVISGGCTIKAPLCSVCSKGV